MAAHNHYLLSARYVTPRTEPFAEAVRFVIGGGEGYFREGDVMEHMSALFRDGVSFNGIDGSTEIGRWDKRSDDIQTDQPVNDDMYYAWVDPDYGWDYDPHLVIYTKAEFMELFADCCRNYVQSEKTHSVFNKNPRDRTAEFAAALAANGMTL